MQDNLYPYSVNRLIVGLKNIRGQRSNNLEKWLKNDGHIYTRQDGIISMFTVHRVHLLNDETPILT